MDTAKRILTKEKLDKKLSGQLSSTPFMSIRYGLHRKVSFYAREELGNKIDKLAVMIGKLTTRESRANRQFKLQIHQSTGSSQNRSYSQRNYQNRHNNRSNSRDRGQYRQDRSRPRYETRYKQNYRRGNFRGNVRNYGRQIGDESKEITTEMTVMVEVVTGPEISSFPVIMATIDLKAPVIVDPGKDADLAK